MRAGCAGCAATWECDEIPLACPTCGSVDIELLGGDELLLESDRVPGLREARRCASASPASWWTFVDSHEHLARVDVSGVTRIINIGLLEDEPLQPGDWVLIHVGFAMSKIDEEEAALALASLQLMGQAFGDELDAFWSSRIGNENTRRLTWVRSSEC